MYASLVSLWLCAWCPLPSPPPGEVRRGRWEVGEVWEGRARACCVCVSQNAAGADSRGKNRSVDKVARVLGTERRQLEDYTHHHASVRTLQHTHTPSHTQYCKELYVLWYRCRHSYISVIIYKLLFDWFYQKSLFN